MLIVALFYFCSIQYSIAQQQYGAGLLSSLFSFPKLCLCSCGIQKRTDSWVTGGVPTSPSQFPWLVTVRTGERYITGSLVSDRHVITAASPLYGIPTSNISVSLGGQSHCDGDNGFASNIETVALHPDFSYISKDNDVAVIKLRYVVPFDKSISPICLPFSGTRETGKVAYTVSFNSTCTGRVVSLPVLSGQQCLTNTANVSLVTSDKGCLGPVASTGVICSDDVGAPVMIQWLSSTSFHLIGVISSADCTTASAPLYTRVVDHLSWIKEQIRSACQCYSKF